MISKSTNKTLFRTILGKKTSLTQVAVTETTTEVVTREEE